MPDVVTVGPVSRIEGHAKITVQLDDAGTVNDARLHVTEFRGFEQFCLGRPVWEMPSLTARTCGICPVSHLLAAAQAGDAIMGVKPPATARRLRRLANLAQLTQSHALSFFHLSGPDLLLGMDADPKLRNVFGLIHVEPEIARRGIRLRAFGQSVIEAVAGRKVHSPGIVPGGVAQPLSEQTRDEIRAGLPEALSTAKFALELYLRVADRFEREIAALGRFPSYFLGLANDDWTWAHHDGHLKIIDSSGRIMGDRIEPRLYADWIGEAAVVDSYLKTPYLKPAVPPGGAVAAGMYRVGPLARVNLCHTMGTPLADAALVEFRQRAGSPALSSFHYHHARLVEVIACLEQMERLLDDPLLTGPTVRAEGRVSRTHGVGVSEAPRGTLVHDYTVDEDGLLTDITMIIATGHNALAMNATLAQAAREFIHGRDIPEGVLNRLEAGVRAYDPCLSCSTHALGRMPLEVEVTGPSGEVLGTARRG
ncbi:MAG TPA: Ni/Fe hydrogenase subunit alpha [Kineosporiaceae bacterium]|nr:Ni/Fe hydrogenase subunit alpha [Kineosporiaceae bacterium]